MNEYEKLVRERLRLVPAEERESYLSSFENTDPPIDVLMCMELHGMTLEDARRIVREELAP